MPNTTSVTGSSKTTEKSSDVPLSVAKIVGLTTLKFNGPAVQIAIVAH